MYLNVKGKRKKASIKKHLYEHGMGKGFWNRMPKFPLKW
jgi:hypothetical protein